MFTKDSELLSQDGYKSPLTRDKYLSAEIFGLVGEILKPLSNV